jgi:hypothetical protein
LTVYDKESLGLFIDFDELLYGVDSPEFAWGCGTTLWECLCDIGNVVNCIPRVDIRDGYKFVIFERINEIMEELTI